MNKSKASKAECIALRIEQRLSFKEISSLTGIPKGTLSGWLKDYPLSAEEVRVKIKNAPRYKTPMKPRPEGISLADKYSHIELNNNIRGKIAESEVISRMIYFNLEVFRPAFDGSCVDIICRNPKNGVLASVQVKWINPNSKGMPFIPVCRKDRTKGNTRYMAHEFDFILGYEPIAEKIYIHSFEEIKNHTTGISITDAACEAWHKILNFNSLDILVGKS